MEPETKTQQHDQLRDELRAVAAARQELSPEHDSALIEHFLDHLSAEMDRRIDERVAQRMASQPQRAGSQHSIPIVPLALVFAIPLTAIAGGITGLAGVIVAWVAIAAIVYFGTRG